ncbi:signal transduction histidine kinase [Phyllobacterium myrsinacearum]|uniref:histidine kinase n=1 Tax=Phyllobacterium myrsinacearum TaxID=28101 RepID=A0A2S9JE36_9HYPH|nr:histidine kinase [Phyllobacterium myrsinacearum]PWV86643.1 signal transduction histidine kinase [Phyllobacterium myrsinacearum]RZU97418.1 signal transduction histidine kinase [Phyllobacterium myrsinacearum]
MILRLTRYLPNVRSLSLRVILFSTLWTIVSFVAIATIISALYGEARQHSFQQLLSAHLFSVIASVSVNDGTLVGRPDPGEVRYSSPFSGWYWSVDPVADNLKGSLRSISLGGKSIDSPSTLMVPFDTSFQRSYTEPGLKGEQLSIVETEVVLDAENRVARFRVMGNLSELEGEIADFRNTLYFYLGVFGIAGTLINAAVILFGLRPLDRVRRSLADIREGKVSRLDEDLPIEIAPLAREMNALIENNRRIMERSRTQVGNLAHSLKTPLSVLANESRTIGGAKGKIVAEQSAAMQVQIQHYLQRARVAAQRDSVVFRASVTPILARLVRVTAKLNPGMDMRFDNRMPDAVFAGEQEDLEEIVGNLLENAGKWGRSAIRLTVSAAGPETMDNAFDISVEDDGPGLAPGQIKDALTRGKRLDESKPGTGLGLSIVHDTVREYGGTLRLERSEDLGGLRARITLPVAGD